MRIIIAGDGKVGYTLAEQLCRADHDVVIIDNNAEALRRADDSLDVLTIEGSAGSVAVLEEAQVGEADLLLAVTSRDELNMACCLLARRLGARHTIARLRSPEYFSEVKIWKEELGLSMVINPEWIAAQEIARMLRYPHADSVEIFAGGRVELLDFHVRESDGLSGRPLSEITPKLHVKVLFAAVCHQGRVTIPDGGTVLQNGDIVFIVGERASATAFFKAIGRAETPVQSVLVIGGGLIALYLAKELERSHIRVKIIEIDPKRAERLDEELDATVILGDGSDQQMLQAEEIGEMDAFVSLTGQDEENLLTAIYAKECGVGRVVAKINRENYADMIRRMGIDSVISPKLLAADHILRYVRAVGNSEGSTVETLYRIVGGQAEALEFTAGPKSRLVGQPLRDLPLRRGVLVAALVREGGIIIPGGDTAIRAGDHVIAITQESQVVDLDDLLEHD